MRRHPPWLGRHTAGADPAPRPGAPSSIAQVNVRNPALLDGRKFHIRLHMIIASLVPLRVYLYEDARVMMAVRNFSADPATFGDPGVHLTNHGVALRLRKAGATLPRTTLALSELLATGSVAGLHVPQFWEKALEIASKSAFSAQMHAGRRFERRVPGTCFDLFGMDLMFDADSIPWLLEVNNAPGLTVEAEVPEIQQQYHARLLPAVLSTFGVDRGHDETPLAAAFKAELQRCLVGLPFDGGQLRLCAREEGPECIAPEDARALWLAFDELCTAQARGFKAAFPRPGATSWHVGRPPRIDRLLWLWQDQCSARCSQSN